MFLEMNLQLRKKNGKQIIDWSEKTHNSKPFVLRNRISSTIYAPRADLKFDSIIFRALHDLSRLTCVGGNPDNAQAAACTSTAGYRPITSISGRFSR